MIEFAFVASLAQLAEHALRKRMVMGSIPIGGLLGAWTFRAFSVALRASLANSLALGLLA